MFASFRGTQIFPLLLLIRLLQQIKEPIPVAARSQAWVCGRSLAGITGSNPEGSMDICLLWVLWVLSGIGLCVEPITGPDESYRVWCVYVICEPRKWGGCRAVKKKKNNKLKWPVTLSLVLYGLKFVPHITGGKKIRDWGYLEEYLDQRGGSVRAGDFLPGGAHYFTYSDQTVGWPNAQ